MKTVRFELHIDDIVDAPGSIDSFNEVFRGEDKAGKVFLLVNTLTGYKQVAICKRPSSEENKCAIYERRPNICRMFGTPPKGIKSKFLQCGWLNGLEQDNMMTSEHELPSQIADIFSLYIQGRL